MPSHVSHPSCRLPALPCRELATSYLSGPLPSWLTKPSRPLTVKCEVVECYRLRSSVTPAVPGFRGGPGGCAC